MPIEPRSNIAIKREILKYCKLNDIPVENNFGIFKVNNAVCSVREEYVIALMWSVSGARVEYHIEYLSFSTFIHKLFEMQARIAVVDSVRPNNNQYGKEQNRLQRAKARNTSILEKYRNSRL